MRTLLHLAAQSQVGVANRNPLATYEANVAGTWSVLEATRRSPTVSEVVTASSDKAYGAQPLLPYDEEMPLLAVNPYDVSKACADLISTSYHRTFGVPVCVTRCGNFFGPGDTNWERLVPGTIRSLLRGERPVIRSDGTMVRDYLYVVDGALAYLRLVESMAADPAIVGEAVQLLDRDPAHGARARGRPAGRRGHLPRARHPRHRHPRDRQPVPLRREGPEGAGLEPHGVRGGRARHDGRLVPCRAGPRRRVTASAGRALAVTGAGGYLGSRLVADLAGGPIPVRALVRTTLPWLATDDQPVVELLDPSGSVADALEGIDTVVHLAGHNEVVASQDPDRALAETALAGRHVVEAARAAGVSRILYVSTIHVYGDRLAPDATVDETVAPAPHGAYAVARLAVEHLVADGPDPVVLRLSNAVGAPAHPEVDRWTLVAADLCRSAATTGALTLRSTGQQWRDFIGLADVVRAIAAGVDPAVVPSGTYNLVSGRSTTVRALAELVQDRFQARTGRRPPLHAPAPVDPDPAPYHLDPSRLAAFGITASQPLAESIDEIIELCLAMTSGARS